MDGCGVPRRVAVRSGCEHRKVTESRQKGNFFCDDFAADPDPLTLVDEAFELLYSGAKPRPIPG